jgi:4-carboxymuconolactone decarboxylase
MLMDVARASSRTCRLLSASLAFVFFSGATAFAQARMRAIPDDRLNAAQKKAVEEFKTTRGQATLTGPWTVLVRVPELLTLGRMWRDHVQNRTVIGNRLTELVILLTAREWTQQYEWNAHYQAAVKAGLKAEIVQAIAEGRRPDQMAEDEQVVYDFCTELHRTRGVSDATYARALAKLGEEGIIEAASIQGFYTLLAMNMNAARTPLAAGVQPPLSSFPR